MDKKMLDKLKGFEAVWRRVEQSRGFAAGAALMPGKQPPKTKATKFSPTGGRQVF